MLKIRLERQGKRNNPIYRIVACEESKRQGGPVVEILGFYNPNTEPFIVKVDREKLNRFLKTGAQMSETVKNITYGKI